MIFEQWFKNEQPRIPVESAHAVIKLASEGGTVPFISRYRKEQTGNLDEVAVQQVIDTHELWDQTIKRQAFIIDAILKQNKLTPELKSKISNCFELSSLENLYLPFKQKRKTKATVAKEAGLEPFAECIWEIGQGSPNTPADFSLQSKAKEFINPDKGIKDLEAVMIGVQDILTERISEITELRELTKKSLLKQSGLQSKKTKTAEKNSKFEMYFNYQEPISSLLKPENSHRYLALRRGWLAKELSLAFSSTNENYNYEDDLLEKFQDTACPKNKESDAAKILYDSAKQALKVYVLPSCQNEIHKDLKAVADIAAIQVFRNNVRQLLLAPPFGSKAVMGIDPGIRTGCKVAVVDNSGAYKEDTVIYIDSKKTLAEQVILAYCQKYQLTSIAVGNGTGGRETESFVRSVIKKANLNIPVVMVNESGASIYSASKAAREEFPKLDLTVRGAISIARRLQDPLAELVKIDPKSIGVGQYQHDVSPTLLKKGLDQVVDSCVNSVGVNLNTASYHLLSHVSGIGPATAKNVVEHRNNKGLFKTKEDLLKVARFNEKAFEQAAGFVRIPTSKNALDNTGVHPERYPLLSKLAKELGKDLLDLVGPGVELVKKASHLKEEIGEYTYNDIIYELEKPGRDSREEFVAFNFREDINAISDLKIGIICPGIVTNVTNFGAFVDIGVHQDGLVHISKLADRFVKDPKEVVSPGDKVKVKVIEINKNKGQIALSMCLGDELHPKKQPHSKPPSRKNRNKTPQKKQNKFSNNPFAKLGEQFKP